MNGWLGKGNSVLIDFDFENAFYSTGMRQGDVTVYLVYDRASD